MIIVDSKWLASHLDDLNLVIIDTRDNITYRFRHIKNARPLGIERIISVADNGANLVVDGSIAERIFTELGIDDSKTVIVYGEYGDPSAARVVWTLMYHGHPNVKLLDIGFRQWHKAGLPTTRQIPTQKPSTSLFKSKINCTIRADAEIIKAKQSDPNVIIVDARTAQEHFQARIPGSILHNWEEGLDDDSGRVIRYKDKLQKDFEQRGITKDKEIICYCHSGTRASHKYLQLKEAGFNNVRMYDGSIIDWAQRHNPLR
ncbi:MAG: rhodanese-like domain-containing protein [Thermoproteota archaeon]|nr:rhodanese-like domain-containing protein [Thermoproteota archaeon]